MKAEDRARAEVLAHKILEFFAGEKLEVMHEACDHAKYWANQDARLPARENKSSTSCRLGSIGESPAN